MRVIYETSTEVDATMLAHHLREQGLHPDVLGGTLSVAAGELPVSFLFRVVVPTSEADEAAAAIESWKRDNVDDSDDVDDAYLEQASLEDPDAEQTLNGDTKPTMLMMMLVVTIVVTAVILLMMLANHS